MRARLRRKPDQFMARVPGLIHVGANVGQERNRYNKYGLEVVWVEPIPEVFAELQKNIASLPRQQAYQELLTDESRAYVFHVASNQGESSSILPLKEHQEIWPNVVYERELILHSKTLDELIAEQDIELHRYKALVLDTQGSELLVLKGAHQTLQAMKYVKVEAADFEAYCGCATVDSLNKFLSMHGFSETRRHAFAAKQQGNGRYYDLIFQRNQQC